MAMRGGNVVSLVQQLIDSFPTLCALPSSNEKANNSSTYQCKCDPSAQQGKRMRIRFNSGQEYRWKTVRERIENRFRSMRSSSSRRRSSGTLVVINRRWASHMWDGYHGFSEV